MAWLAPGRWGGESDGAVGDAGDDVAVRGVGGEEGRSRAGGDIGGVADEILLGKGEMVKYIWVKSRVKSHC